MIRSSLAHSNKIDRTPETRTCEMSKQSFKIYQINSKELLTYKIIIPLKRKSRNNEKALENIVIFLGSFEIRLARQLAHIRSNL